MSLSRRAFAHQTLGSLLTYTLLETVFTRNLLSADGKRLTNAWLNDLQQLGKDIKGQKLTQTDWQAKVEELYKTVDLGDFLKFLKFEDLEKGVKFKSQGELSLRPEFPEVEGLPKQLVFGHQIFALKKDRSVVPHAHDNMATAFLILKGNFQGRHYDRLEDEADALIIKPTIDRPFHEGEYSTVSDFKDNVHWFKATSETAFIYNIHVIGINPEKKGGGRIYIDPEGEKLSDGRIRAKKVSAIDVIRKYG